MMTNQSRIEQRVLSWPDVTTHEHQFGGTEYRLGKREIGHYHAGMGLVDIPFPRKVRDEALAEGLAERRHVLPDTGWVSKGLREPDNVDGARPGIQSGRRCLSQILQPLSCRLSGRT